MQQDKQILSFKDQDYNKIKNDCLKREELFSDDLFKLDVPGAMWLRPKNLTQDPRFFVGGVSRFDVVQGANADCWLVVAMANLTRNPNLFQHVVPKDQSFTENYAGIFRFNIWQRGRWVEVVIDDKLPTKNNKLMFLHSPKKNEFWSALLEKAYAKLYGSYNELTAGWFGEAMVDFTGGITERVSLSPTPKNLGTIIRKSIEKSSFMCIFMKNDPSVKEMVTEEGLVKGHAYSINNVQTVTSRGSAGSTQLVRLRNPWGKIEWKGAWSDSSKEWESVSEEEKNKIGLKSENDGEFWMSVSDLARNFEYIDICHLSPDTFNNADEKQNIGWEANVYRGEWIKNITAGGFFLETFHLNPQYRITLTDIDDDEDKLCTVIIGLMQRNKTRQVWHSVGFTAFHLEGPEKLSKKPLSKKYILENFEKSSSSKFKKIRENVVRDMWEPGVYCIMPSTYKPHEEGRYMLRVYTEKKALVEEHETQIEIQEIPVDKSSEPLINTSKATQMPRGKKLLRKSDEEISELFHKIAGNEKEISWQGLQTVLEYALTNSNISNTDSMGLFSKVITFVSNLFSGSSENKLFTKDECRTMIFLLDDDLSGKMGQREFQILWRKLQYWEMIFLNYSNGTDNIATTELNKAFKEMGYSIKTSDLGRLIRKYSDNNGKLAFDDFVMCAVEVLKTDVS